MSAPDKRLAAWFENRRWRVMDELSGTVPVGGVQISYCRGAFEIDQPGVFATPLGHRGRRGFIIAEDTEDDSRAAFGEATLRRAQAAFGTISGLPEEDEGD